MVEHAAVNRVVAGSSPASGAIVKNRSFPVVFSKKAGLSASQCKRICQQKLVLPAKALARCLVLLLSLGCLLPRQNGVTF